jgi:ATP-dependent Lon protease
MFETFNNLRISAISEMSDEGTEFIPLLSPEDEEQMRNEELPEILPILPLRNTVLFPGVVIPLTVGRDKSIQLIKDYYRGSRIIGTVAQKNGEVEDPGFGDLFSVGTVAYIIKLLQMPDGNTTAIIQGKKCFRMEEQVQENPYIKAKVLPHEPVKLLKPNRQFNALVASLKDLSVQIIQKSPNIPSDAAFAIKNIESPSFLVNFISSNLNADVLEKQKLLESLDLLERANKVLGMLTRELQEIELKNQIQSRVKTEIDKQQRDYLLHQQLKTIQEELGGSPNQQEINDLKEKSAKKAWPQTVAEIFDKELAKLQRMNPAAMEYSMQMNYLEVLVDLPWDECTKDIFDLKRSQKVLDEDHYGLEKVKERIIEYLAVLKLKGDMKSPILCLVGPPGVGKTSLGKSIARAVGRKYVRMSLGGLRDEAEIRGHRKTYIGAMPGRVIQSLKKAKSSNPVFVLDEIDKVMGLNINGDPSAALLEVLDPEQNQAFHDNYLDIDYDLSRVMFLATANTLNTIHPALRDRMEVIEISGYLIEEKIEIATKHLIPKQFREHGLEKSKLKFPKPVIRKIVEDYTRESGVRNLERLIAKVIRNRARFIISDDPYNIRLTPEDIREILGPEQYHIEKDLPSNIAGVATGLAWTSVGGQILFVEVSLSRGKGNLTLTGSLGDIMKESATIAYEYLKSHSHDLGINSKIFEKWNVHIHIPEGATPKDGPSAGITLFTALASAFTQRKIRHRIAMTGEITLRGKVLPVGGIKEKILAARRASITDIVLSGENRKDIAEIPQRYIDGVKFHYIDSMMDVAGFALLDQKVDKPLDLTQE